MDQVQFITVSFRYKRAGQRQCSSHESMHLKPEQVEPYIERLCSKAVDAGIQITYIEVRNYTPSNRWGEPGWQVPWSWYPKLPLLLL